VHLHGAGLASDGAHVCLVLALADRGSCADALRERAPPPPRALAGLAWLAARMDGLSLPPASVQATLLEFTAASIAASVRVGLRAAAAIGATRPMVNTSTIA
jgi:hypothetical protein